MSTIVLTGGGTAGHIMPNLALLPELRKFFENIHYIGGNGMEKDLIPLYDLPFHSVSTIKFDRTHLFKNIKIPFTLTKGIGEAKKLLGMLKPNVIFAKGGYVSLPACYAAKSLGIPVILHESDYSLGLANRLVSKFAEKTLTSFQETEGGIYVGNPIRQEILSGSKLKVVQAYKLDITKKTILVTGGSSGAKAINNILYKALPLLTVDFNVIHIAGKSGDFSIQMPYYHQIVYSNEIADLYAAADLVVSRGGANALSELAALGKPALIIPLPKGNSRGDQLDNAKSYAKRGFAEILLQEELYVESLLAKIESALTLHPQKLNVTEINKNIVREIISVV